MRAWTRRASYISRRYLSSEVAFKQVSDIAKQRSFPRKYNELNHVAPTEIDEILDSLKHQAPQKGLKPEIAEFINPQDQHLTNLLAKVEKNEFPENLLSVLGHKSKEDFAQELITKSLYRRYVGSKVYSYKPQDTTIDLSNPAEWFPQARKMKRKIIMHVGPTNSGKTYRSLQKLAQAQLGYYAGPLRLLAREIFEKFNNENVPCNLITGEEVVPTIDKYGKTSEISLGTIEMIPLNKKMDVCVIDEIQMLGDPNRGAAWTAAVLGVQASEIHLCGEELAVPIIKRICEVTGDELIIKTFERLGKLTVQSNLLRSYRDLQPGDCVIAFSKRAILEIKLKIEKETRLKVGVIYGALPPEIRTQEASRFNLGKYDVLVATDAVGMGLNLRIKRIVFYSTSKFDGKNVIPLTVSQTKQIAGRAGRFSKDKGELEGFVTAMNRRDLLFIKKTMKKPNQDLEQARVWPSNQIWKQYMTHFPPNTLFYEVLLKFKEEIEPTLNQDFCVSEVDPRIAVLEFFLRLDLYKRITVDDQLTLSLAPMQALGNKSAEVIHTFLTAIANNTPKSVFQCDIVDKKLLSRSARPLMRLGDAMGTLSELEEMHKLVLLFLWLSQRWPTLFIDKELATDLKLLIEKRISQELDMTRKLNKARRR